MIYRAPSGTFINDYMAHMAEQETAAVYDLWCALWLLSAACGRYTVVARPRAPVFLNLYCILVAESGVTRKSSAVRQVSHITRSLLADDPRIGLVENKITAGHVDDMLHTRTMDTGSAQLAIVISELATFLGTGQGTGNMPALLTDLYDCPTSRRGGGTLTRGPVVQRDIWMSFLSASTPTWLFRSVNPTVIEGGFTSRCLFIVSDKPKARIAWPTNESIDDSVFVQRLRDVRAKAKRFTTITLNDTAMRDYRAWYQRRPTHMDAFRASFEAREDAHVLRLAALLCVNDDTWVIQKQHISVAIRMITELKAHAASMFTSTQARSKWILGIESLRNALLAAGTDTVPRSKLFLKSRAYLDHAEFISLLDTMHESGYVERHEFRHDGAGRPVDLYKATQLLRARGVVEQLANTV